jgi:hypothetical protein
MTDWISFEAFSWCSGIVVWDLGVRNGLGFGIEQQDCRATPSNLKGYPGVDESFSAEILRLEILLLQIENHTRYVLALEKATPKESRNALSTAFEINLFKSIVICCYR